MVEFEDHNFAALREQQDNPDSYNPFNEEQTAPNEGGLSTSRGEKITLHDVSIIKVPQSEPTPINYEALSINDQIVYDDVVGIAVDYLEATDGEDFTIEHYKNMLVRKKAYINLGDILRVLKEWSYVQQEARKIYEERRARDEGPNKEDSYWSRHFNALLKAAGVSVKRTRLRSPRATDKPSQLNEVEQDKTTHIKIYNASELLDNIPENLDAGNLPTYYFDLSTREILEGEQSLNSHISHGANIKNVHDLSTLLRNFDVPLEKERYATIDQEKWSTEQCKQYGRFINAMIAPLPEGSRKRHLTDDVFNHLFHLGIGPSSWWLAREFGSLGNFYKEINVDDTYRRGQFDNLTLDFLIAYTRQIGEEKGRRPKGPDFEEMASRNRDNPSADMVYERTKDMGGISKLIELAGYFVTETLDKNGSLEWGVKFMIANEGQVPNATHLKYLAVIQKGPSQGAIIRRFGSISNFQTQLLEKYPQHLEQQGYVKKAKLAEIEEGLTSGQLRSELFKDVPSDDEKVVRHSKFKLISALLPSSSDYLKISLSRRSSREIVNQIINYDSSSTPQKIEQIATELGLYEDIWPRDIYLQDLKMGEGYRKFLDEFNKKLRDRRKELQEVKRKQGPKERENCGVNKPQVFYF